MIGTVFHQNTDFTAEDYNWPAHPTQTAQQARESCAKIRHIVDKQGLPEDAHFFFRKEMQFAEKKGGFWWRFPFKVFKALSDYGNSLMIPILWLTGVIVFGWLVATYHFASEAIRLGGQQTSQEAMALSFANTFAFFGFQRLYFGTDYLAIVYLTNPQAKRSLISTS